MSVAVRDRGPWGPPGGGLSSTLGHLHHVRRERGRQGGRGAPARGGDTPGQGETGEGCGGSGQGDVGHDVRERLLAGGDRVVQGPAQSAALGLSVETTLTGLGRVSSSWKYQSVSQTVSPVSQVESYLRRPWLSGGLRRMSQAGCIPSPPCNISECKHGAQLYD